MHSASAAGSGAPSHSMPTWWNWRKRPFWGRSPRNIASAYHALNGAEPCGTRLFSTTARTTPAVPSGRRARRCLALSFASVPSARTRSKLAPEKTRNISLRTTSVDWPMPCTNTSSCSIAGVSMGSNPNGPNTSAATSCIFCQARISRPMRSLVPSARCACMWRLLRISPGVRRAVHRQSLHYRGR